LGCEFELYWHGRKQGKGVKKNTASLSEAQSEGSHLKDARWRRVKIKEKREKHGSVVVLEKCRGSQEASRLGIRAQKKSKKEKSFVTKRAKRTQGKNPGEGTFALRKGGGRGLEKKAIQRRERESKGVYRKEGTVTRKEKGELKSEITNDAHRRGRM